MTQFHCQSHTKCFQGVANIVDIFYLANTAQVFTTEGRVDTY